MTEDAPKHAKWYGLYTEQNRIIGILGVIHFPCINKRLKKCSRLVILPDFQGIGLGTKFLEEISKLYLNDGFDFAITTTAKNLVFALARNDKWMLTRHDKQRYRPKYKKRIYVRDIKTYTFFAVTEAA